MVTSGNEIPGYKIEKLCGLVVGNSSTLEVSLAGKRIQHLLQDSLNEAVSNALATAKMAGGNAVIGCKTDIIRPPVGISAGLIHFIVTGTAVYVTPDMEEVHPNASEKIIVETASSDPVTPVSVDIINGKCTCPNCGQRQNTGRKKCMSCGVPFNND